MDVPKNIGSTINFRGNISTIFTESRVLIFGLGV